MPSKFTKKPVTIDAMQWDGTAQNAGDVIDWVLPLGGTIRYREANESPERNEAQLRVETVEGPIYASPGDWIIRGVKGEFYPCKPDIFAETYTPEVPGQQHVLFPEGHIAIVLDPAATIADVIEQFGKAASAAVERGGAGI